MREERREERRYDRREERGDERGDERRREERREERVLLPPAPKTYKSEVGAPDRDTIRYG